MKISPLDNYLIENVEEAVSEESFTLDYFSKKLGINHNSLRQQARLSHFVEYIRGSSINPAIVLVRREVLSRYVYNRREKTQARNQIQSVTVPDERPKTRNVAAYTIELVRDEIKTARVFVASAVAASKESDVISAELKSMLEQAHAIIQAAAALAEQS